MTILQDWLDHFPHHRFVPLFDTDDGLTVRTLLKGAGKDRRILKRSPAFDAAMIDMVEAGLQDDEWHGFLYIMGVGEQGAFTPLYVGKAEKRGKSNNISANLARIRTNHGFFGRWGYNTDYHVGDLSHALFEFKAYREPTKKYRRWAQALFQTFDPR